MKFELLGLLAIVATATADDKPEVWCKKEWHSCDAESDDTTKHCCPGYQCEGIDYNGVEKMRCVPDPTYRNQCCLPNRAWGCDTGDCCEGFYCWKHDSGTRSECRAGAEFLELHDGLCETGTEIDTEYWQNTPVPLYNRCQEAGGQSDCLEGYLCEHMKNRENWPPRCVKDPSVETECCKKMGYRHCEPGDCCPGSFCFDDGNGYTQCRPGIEPSGKHDGMCDPPSPDECRKNNWSCRRFAGIDDCCEGYECLDIGDDKSKCLPKLDVKNECCKQSYEYGCDTGDCCAGNYCWEPGTSKSRCKPGPEIDLKKNGLCEADYEISADAWKDTCTMPHNRCDPGVGGLGSQGDCCKGFLCQEDEKRPYSTCQVDEDIDTTCCLPYLATRCTPGDCCDGFMCEQQEWTSRCVPGSEVTGRKDGLCSTDETLLQCAGHVGKVWGDPHITTFDGYKYNCQGRGEFVVAKSQETYFEVQGRFVGLESHGKPHVSTSRGWAVSASEDGSIPIVQVNHALELPDDPKTFMFNECEAQLWIGGKLQDVENIEDVEGVSVNYNKYSMQIQYGPELNYAAVEIRSSGSWNATYGCILHATICLPSTIEGETLPDFTSDVVGLLGSPNNNTEDDWINSKDGSIIPLNGKSSAGYEFCTKNYCVRDPNDSLFTYGKGDSHGDYMDCGAGFGGDIDISKVPQHIKEKCNFDQFCMEEAALNGDEGANEAIRQEENENEIKKPIIGGNSPPMGDPPADDEDEEIDEDDCADNVKMIGISGVSEFERTPIRVVSQDEDSVTLKVRNPFLDKAKIVNNIYYQYEKEGEQCDMSEDIEDDFEDEITVKCWDSKPITIVRVWVADSDQLLESEEATIAECCHVEDGMDYPVVEWVFQVSCVPMCADT